MRLDHLLSKENYLLFDFESSYFQNLMCENFIIRKNGGVAQLGEHLPCKQGVRSSTLLISTICTLKTEYFSDYKRHLSS